MKNIVITGAAGGVGGMLAKGLAQEGHHLICLDRDLEGLKKLEKQINTQCKGTASIELVDMMNESQIKEVGERTKQQCGSIDIWINNVGVNNHNAIGPTWELESQNWWKEVSLNLFTTYLGTAVAINLMKSENQGYIINLGGGGVQEPKPFGSAYGAAKTANVKFTETVNLELKEKNIGVKVYAFNPGFIRNERTERLVESDVCKTYMPELEQILKYGEMSDIQDSIHLINAIISGRADHLSGRYFFSDDKNIDEIIAKEPDSIEEGMNVLRVELP